jgi:tetratricopeptide (TPR) repeat protein
MSKGSIGVDGSLESLVGQVADDFLRRQRDGERPDVEEYIARYPQAAEMLRPILASLRLLECSRSGQAAAVDEAPAEVEGTLGDFRILREVGRGGMGVVYEAVQISLGRHVALKVLPFAAALDERQLQRFKNEAQAAAGLHHTNIVPVYAVGCERGVHFYAMQLISGQTLASVIAELRQRQNGAEVAADPQRTSAYVAAPAVVAATAEVDTPLGQALSTQHSTRSVAFFSSVARLGMQAAEALEHAHQVGVVHRDIKPGNLMVDVRGNLWVTDFGLAHIHSDTRLTMTGDLVGTLRYMSPEQALAQRVGIDQRTDVYSLGATLYELLTLRPVFDGRDRQELLRQIAFDEPQAPRRLNRAIPVELETIVLKALAKNPAERYATAQELADDLDRFLKDEPIRARRPTLVQRVRRWGRRHRPAVRALVAVLLMAALLGGSAGLWWLHKQTVAHVEAKEALREAEDLLSQEKWPEAISAVQRAKGVLAGVWADRDLRRQVDELARDLEMARLLQEALLLGAAVKDGQFDEEATRRAYVDAFAWYGLDVDNTDPAEAGQRIHQCATRKQMAAALDDWASRRKRGSKGRSHLLAISRIADPDVWRNRLRDAFEGQDPRALKELVASARPDELPPRTVVLLCRFAQGTPEAARALAVLRQAQVRHSDDFWLNHELGWWSSLVKAGRQWTIPSISRLPPPRLEEAVRYYTTAAALRPQSPGAHLNLAAALDDLGKRDEAIAEYREAIRHKRDYAQAHYNLGNSLCGKRKWDEAIACYRKAIEIDPKDAWAYTNMGNALRHKGKVKEAIACYQKATALDPRLVNAHNCLGSILCDVKRDHDGAIACFRQAIAVSPKFAAAHTNLGNALDRKGQRDKAIACYRQAIVLDPNYASAHYGLGLALYGKGQVEEAIACYHKAIELDPKYAKAHTNLGNALRRKGQVEEAIACHRKAIAIDPADANAHNSLGVALQDKGKVDEAIECYQKAITFDPRFALAHTNLGNALMQQGNFSSAQQSLRRCLELLPANDPQRNLVTGLLRQCQQWLEAESKLTAFLAGKGAPADAVSQLRMAMVAQVPANKRYRTAALLYRDAFARQPRFADAHRYDAACAAALAGCGKGNGASTLDPGARLVWRNQALAWLQAERAALSKKLKGEVPGQAAQARQALEHWLRDPDLAGVRELNQLARLPVEEGEAWFRLWMDVGRALQGAD